MAIDSTLFAAEIPAGTYAVGDKVPLAVIRGPAVVRDGYGAAKLKKTFVLHNPLNFVGHVEIKNSNWVDPIYSIAPSPGATSLNDNSNAIQKGHDCELQPNSGWDVNFIIDVAATTTTATDVIALIDIDYPSVLAVANPKNANGTPCSNIRGENISVTAQGSSRSMVWTTYNVDILKAGYKYLLSSAYFRCANAQVGFLSISGAAGQAGLERIIPVVPSAITNLRYEIDYSTPLVKGPFNINYAALGTSGTAPAVLELDWVKKN